MKDKKICGKCNNLKSTNEFHKRVSSSDGLHSWCKSCKKEYQYMYYRSERGLIKYIYHTQKASSISRGHNNPKYSMNELIEWIRNNPHWNDLYIRWIESDYKKELVPSIDRLDDNKGYSFDNIRLVTWAENMLKASEDRKSGRHLCGNSRAVIQLTRDGSYVDEFKSLSIAARTVGTSPYRIWGVCNGKDKTAVGFKWRYKNG